MIIFHKQTWRLGIRSKRVWASDCRARQAYSGQLNEVFQGLASGVSGLPRYVNHRVGYSPDKGDLLAALTRGWQRDRVMGMTHSGPHRGDLEILCRA